MPGSFSLLFLLLFAHPLSFQQPAASYRIVIDKSLFTLSVYRDTALVKQYPVAVGSKAGDKERRGDRRTPEGNFVISQIQNARAWVHDFGDGKGPIDGAYGPWFLRLDTGSERTNSGKAWTGIGIHGTHDPVSIGTRATEGCIRLQNDDLIEFKKLVRIGTPVVILP